MSRQFFNAKIQEQVDKNPGQRKLNDKDGHTIGEFVNAVMSIETEEHAKWFADGYLDWLREQCLGLTPHHNPEGVMRSNIGWCFGENMSEERIAMWAKVCGASHSFFGQQLPSDKEALDMGYEAAKKDLKEIV